MTADGGRTERHPDLDRLAEFEAGDADSRTRAHVEECAECQQHVARIAAVRAELAALPDPVMPPDVATRIDDALHAIGAGTVIPLQERPRRFARFSRLPGGGALAGGVAAAVIALLATVLVVGHYASDDDGGTAAVGTASGSSSKEFASRDIVTVSGHDYSGKKAAIESALPALLAHDVQSLRQPLPAPANGSTDSTTSGDNDAQSPAAARAKPSRAAPGVTGLVPAGAATRLRDNPAALRQCVVTLTGEATVPLAVDIGVVNNKPVAVIVVPAVGRDDRVDVFVVPPSCPATQFTLYPGLPRS